ncbi:MAG: site-specific integrase [Balneolaceae bacterium]
MPSTFKLVIRQDRPNGKGECPIYLRITCDRKKKYHNTGVRLIPKYWNDESELVRKNHRTYSKINDDLERLLDKAKQAARELRRDEKETVSAIKDRLIGASTNNFFSLADEYQNGLELNQQYHLSRHVKTSIRKLEDFNGSRNLLYTEINSDYLERFKKHLMTVKGNKGSTIQKNLGNIRTVIELARRRGLIFRDPFENFEPVKLGQTIYKTKLSLEEIQILENIELEKESTLWHARNAFVLSFYLCGMRFGDIATLKWKNVVNGLLEYQMNKTGKSIHIEIPNGAEKILRLYKNKKATNDDYIYPFCSNTNSDNQMKIKQKISSWNALINGQNKGKISGLKLLAKLAEIEKPISMHVARHSFAQHMAEKGISMYKMMLLLGHNSLKTTEQYLDTINVKVANETLRKIF